MSKRDECSAGAITPEEYTERMEAAFPNRTPKKWFYNKCWSGSIQEMKSIPNIFLKFEKRVGHKQKIL